jgi:hypothetical protein
MDYRPFICRSLCISFNRMIYIKVFATKKKEEEENFLKCYDITYFALFFLPVNTNFQESSI